MAPIIFELWGFTLYAYTLFGALGFLAVATTTMRRGAFLGIPGHRSLHVVLAMGLLALVGGRLAWFFAMPSDARDLLDLSSGGLLFFGAAVGGGLGGLLAIRLQRLPFFAVTDLLALGLPVGHALFRVGCFLAGCCWGTPSELPWSVTFHTPVGPAPVHTALHPTQLYEALLLVGVAIGVRKVYARRAWNGQVMAVYLVSYGVIRIVMELVRGDTIVVTGPVTLGQLGGLVLIGLGLGFFGLVARWRRGRVVVPITYGSRTSTD